MKDVYLKIITAIGIWFAIVAVFGLWEYDILKAEMVLNEKILSHGLVAQGGPFTGGKVTYVVEMFVWTALLLILGLLWSKILFPHRNILERVVFSMVFGIFVMPLSIFIPFVAITGATVLSTLFGATAPAFIGPILDNIVALFVDGQEQIYEFTNVFAFLIVGLVFALLKKRTAPVASS